MFERYTERARRMLFFARYEASQFGSISIELEHLLLGLLREPGGVVGRMLEVREIAAHDIRRQVEERISRRGQIPTSVEIPFHADTKRALTLAAQEADRLLHTYIGAEHLLLGVLSVDQSPAASILAERGLRLADARETLVQVMSRGGAVEPVPQAPGAAAFRHSEAGLPDFVPSYDVHIMHSRTGQPPSIRTSDTEWYAMGFPLERAIAALWDADERRIELPQALPHRTYDIALKLPATEARDRIEALVRQAIERQLNVTVSRESRPTDVYVVTAPQGAGPSLRGHESAEGSGAGGIHVAFSTIGDYQGGPLMFPVENFAVSGLSIAMMCAAFEELMDRPVIDETGLTGEFDLTLQSIARDRATFIDALREEAGLILTPARREIAMLIVRSGSEGSG
jgi:uncharacterized protein (TIGR03435 family)